LHLDEDFFLAGFEATRWNVIGGHREEKHKVVFQQYKNGGCRFGHHGPDGIS